LRCESKRDLDDYQDSGFIVDIIDHLFRHSNWNAHCNLLPGPVTGREPFIRKKLCINVSEICFEPNTTHAISASQIFYFVA
jgi:hypothetical protein